MESMGMRITDSGYILVNGAPEGLVLAAEPTGLGRVYLYVNDNVCDHHVNVFMDKESARALAAQLLAAAGGADLFEPCPRGCGYQGRADYDAGWQTHFEHECPVQPEPEFVAEIV